MTDSNRSSITPRRWTFEGTVFKHMPEQFIGTHVEGPWLPRGEAVEVVEATAYDDLREAATWVVLNWDAERTQHGSMPALRQALGLPGERPTREEAERRINEHIGVEAT